MDKNQRVKKDYLWINLEGSFKNSSLIQEIEILQTMLFQFEKFK